MGIEQNEICPRQANDYIILLVETVDIFFLGVTSRHVHFMTQLQK